MDYIFNSYNIKVEETGKIKLWNYLLHSTFNGTSFIFYRIMPQIMKYINPMYLGFFLIFL